MELLGSGDDDPFQVTGYKILIRRDGCWYAFYVWAASEYAASLTAKCHLVYGG